MRAHAASVGLWTVAAGAGVLFATQAVLAAWALHAAGLALLARDPRHRRAALLALAVFGATVLAALLLSPSSFGIAGRPLGGWGGSGIDGAVVSVAIVAGPLTTMLVLAGGAWGARVRSLARGSLGAAAFLAPVVVAVALGERIAGLIGLFGAVALALGAASLAVALWQARAAPEPAALA